MSTPLFDPRLRSMRLRRAFAQSGRDADFLLKHAATDLIERLEPIQREFERAVDLDSLTPMLGNMLSTYGKVGHTLRLGPLPTTGPDIVAAQEALPLADESIDLAISLLSLHWSNDLPGTLKQIRRALKPDGLFLAIVPGGDTLIELRESLTAAEAEITGRAAPRVAPFAQLQDFGSLLHHAGFALPVVDRDRLTVRYASARALMKDLRAMGATNTLIERSRVPLPRAVFSRCDEIYAERFGDADGRVPATFEFFSLAGWAPHPDQQKPLRPGSATMRLADALGTSEQSAGEKPKR